MEKRLGQFNIYTNSGKHLKIIFLVLPFLVVASCMESPKSAGRLPENTVRKEGLENFSLSNEAMVPLSKNAIVGLSTISLYIKLCSDKNIHDMEIIDSLHDGDRIMATFSKFDFKFTERGWFLWSRWVQGHNYRICLACIQDEDSEVLDFGTKLALSSGDYRLVEQFLQRTARLSESQRRIVSLSIMQWGKSPEFYVGVFHPDENFWERFNAEMEPYSSAWRRFGGRQ